MKAKVLCFIGFILTAVCFCQADEYLYIYRNGKIVFQSNVEDVDSLGILNKRQLRILDKNRQLLFSSMVTAIDSMCIETFGSDGCPVADILDVSFQEDGKAIDVSPSKQSISLFGKEYISTYYSPVYNRWVAHFENTWGKEAACYYKYNYAKDEKVKAALANGHSMEALFLVQYNTSIPASDGKFFTNHEAGGTGFSVPASTQNISFTANVSTTGQSKYAWAYSGITPQNNVFYHVVGVWDKAANRVQIYVNGALKKTTSAIGEFVFPEEAAQWFAIGADASTGAGAQSILGDVAIARIYDKALTSEEISKLWEKVQNSQASSTQPTLVTNVHWLSNVPVQPGHTYEISGKGFKEGDILTFSKLGSSEGTVSFPITLMAHDSVSIIIPEGLTDGVFRIKVQRDEETQDLGLITLIVVDQMPNIPLAVAHRGYWDTPGSAQNSRYSMKKAVDAGLDGIELDVWLTTDNHIMVNHDADLNGVTIQTSTYDQVKNLTLSNGEKIVDLDEFLEMLSASSKKIRYVIEIKSHSSKDRSLECARRTVAAVHAAGLQDFVEYHAFNFDVCKEIVKQDPNADVGYLNKDKAPSELAAAGINTMSYNYATYAEHPSWVTDAHKLGVRVNVFTPSCKYMFTEMINQNANVIGTDNIPELLKTLEYYKKHHDK